MNLSEKGNMFTEKSFGENAGGIEGDPSTIGLGLDNGEQCDSISPSPYLSSCVAADGSSVNMVQSDISGDLLSAFDSICIDECFEIRDGVAPDVKTDAFDPFGQTDLSRQQPEDGEDTIQFDSSDLVAEPSTQGNGEAENLVDIDKTCRQSPLIVYTSSRRRSLRNTKSNENRKSEKPSKCRRMGNKNSVFDFTSLQILRRSRSSFAKRTRSSVWGNMWNILPATEENGGVGINLGDENKLRKRRAVKGKRKAIRDQRGGKSTGKRCTPTGHISLKIRIGNKSCSMVNAIEDFSASGKDTSELTARTHNNMGKKVLGGMVSPCERNLEKMISSEASVVSTHFEVRGTFDNQSFNTVSDFHEIRGLEEDDNLGVLTGFHCSDVGTSPDSEVINPVTEAPLCEKGIPDLQDSPVVSKACVSTNDVSILTLSPNHSKKGKKKYKLQQLDSCMLESGLTCAETRNNAKTPISTEDVSSLKSTRTKSKKGKKKDKLREVGNSIVESNLTSAKTTNNVNAPVDLGVGQKIGDVSYCSDASKTRTAKPYLNGAETKPSSELVAASVSSDFQACNTLIPCSNVEKSQKCSRAKVGKTGRCRIVPSDEDETFNEVNENNVDGEQLVDEKAAACGDLNGVESLLQEGNLTRFDLGVIGEFSNGLSGPINSHKFSSDGVMDQYDQPRNAWVLCDECQKWRRISATLADKIEETNCGWTCRDNTDEDFADCSIPQEKSNSEINEELEISDASCEEYAYGTLPKSNQDRADAAQQSSWSLIKSNLFMHRSRKTQTIDEVMVCHCKPPSDGRLGCGAKCLNRMLNIECVDGTCPCGELCSNQQFQKRKYAKLKWFRCGKKGYGLQALENISQGQFLIEYVGEVLNVNAHEARQREYAMNGHKHFYFMTLNGSEVIDACAKGNLGRFINHSCNPNCRTEKWMVNGEVCIGLFALRDIKKGEEVTFDYNYVRVFGAAAKKCVCGSPNCRGYIGGDLTNSEVIAQDDSDDEFAEPVMICEHGEMKEDWIEIMSTVSNNGENESAVLHTSETSPQKIEGVNSAQFAETRVGEGFSVYKSVGSAVHFEEKLNTSEISDGSLKGSLPAALKVAADGLRSQMDSSSMLMDNSLQPDGMLDKAVSSAHDPLFSVSHSESLPEKIEYKRKLKYATEGGRDDLAKSHSVAKTNRSLSSIKKRKPKVKVLNDRVFTGVDKLSAAPHKPKKSPEPSLNCHSEAVEEKLNELLDPEGGISKRKDASRGYLKLLFLTAATGNNGNGESIKSNRDLSMILDALLKTKSRTVLVDVINKNGLQMLHNIMKRYRKEFIKTPILRKLLKVLEYLATREILTLEHITGGPPCPGVESFKDSILTLTEHDDKQVHQIARNFRDKWIPRSLRKNCCIERDDGRTEFHHPSGHGGLSALFDHQSDADGTAETSTLDFSASGGRCGSDEPKTRKRKSRWDDPVGQPHSKTRMDLISNEKITVDEDIPPGFSSPCNDPMIPSDSSSTAINIREREIQVKQHPSIPILGEPQLRFIARTPLSYGVPYSVMQQFGIHQAEKSEHWTVAPGVVFHPFPPLPPCATGDVEQSTSTARCASLSEEPTEKAGLCSDPCVSYRTEPPEKNVAVANGRPDFQQGGSCGLGRKYFRQQKSNHPKLAPPWVRMRNGWGFTGNNVRNGLPGVGLANGPNDFRNSYSPDEVYRREFI